MPNEALRMPNLFSMLPNADAKRTGIFIRRKEVASAHSLTQPEPNISLHFHDYIQIWYTESGRYCNTVHGKKNYLSEGDLIIIPPFTTHIVSGEFGQPITYFMVDMSAEFIKSILPPDRQHIFLHPLHSSFPVHFEGAAMHEMTRLFNDLCIESEKNISRLLVLHREKIRSFFMHISDAYLAQHSDFSHTNDNSRYHSEISRAIEYIAIHYTEPITLADMCKLTALARTTFCEQFKLCTGYTFSRYLVIYRAWATTYPLMFTNLPVQELMEECGFTSKSNYIRLFKDIYGMTPRDFRMKFRYENRG